MQKEAEYLSEWFVRYTKNRDLSFRKIKDIKEENNKVIIIQNTGQTTHHYIIPFIEDFSSIIKDTKEEDIGIITYNTPEAFESLIKNWKSLIRLNSLVIYFVNPFSKMDKKWIIRPRTHALISDEDTLEDGIRAIFQNVDIVNKKELLKIIG